jgi:hypothetical protein
MAARSRPKTQARVRREKTSSEILRKIAILGAISKTRSAMEIPELQAIPLYWKNTSREA